MATVAQTEPQLMTKKQVAEFLQCSQRQVELLTNKGRLPKPVYLGESSPRWKREELLASLEAKSESEVAR
jgi:predicted DNA-binding transcriptional regulator AlpA